MSRRTERVGNLIRNTIGELVLTKISDPRIDPAKTSITHVEVADDFLTAKVFISVLGTDSKQRNALRALRHAAGHIQELMMRHIKLRATPILEFVLDENLKKTLQTLQLIEQAMAEIRENDETQPQEVQTADEDPLPSQ